jgi:hypothetical protein
MRSRRRPGVATDLGVLAHAAEDDRAFQVQVFPVHPETLVDLGGQFACGRQDEDPGAARRCGPPFSVKALDNGKGEGGRLARAGLGTAEKVSPLEEAWNRSLLDGGGVDVPLLPDGALQGLDEV